MSAVAAHSGAPEPVPLVELAPGVTATVLELDASISIWRDRLVAYGIAPGRQVEVVQHAPVTVVRVERIDLAFEARIAAGIVVAPSPGAIAGTG